MGKTPHETCHRPVFGVWPGFIPAINQAVFSVSLVRTRKSSQSGGVKGEFGCHGNLCQVSIRGVLSALNFSASSSHSIPPVPSHGRVVPQVCQTSVLLGVLLDYNNRTTIYVVNFDKSSGPRASVLRGFQCSSIFSVYSHHERSPTDKLQEKNACLFLVYTKTGAVST